jgi:hypothetical protein
MNWIKRLFSKKENTNQFDIHVVTKRFPFGSEFVASGITYKYLYSEYGNDVFYKDTDRPCIVLFNSDAVNI